MGKWRWLSLLLSGTICGVSGVFYASLSGPSLTFGASLLLPAFAAVFLGSTQIRPGHFNVGGTLIAVYVLATGVQGLQFVTGSVQWLSAMFNGLALILAVAFAGRSQRAAARRRRAERHDSGVGDSRDSEQDHRDSALTEHASPLARVQQLRNSDSGPAVRRPKEERRTK